MSEITVIGAGAFGTALAISLARDGKGVGLMARDPGHVSEMQKARENARRLPGLAFPDTLSAVRADADIASICLMAIPTQTLSAVLAALGPRLDNKHVVACCKGVDLKTGKGPTALISEYCAGSVPAILSGPSFAVDIANGLPTALTLATEQDAAGQFLQDQLSTTNLRLYRSSDVIGVELGGALKNIIAISAGIAIGAGLGESARAALMTRGFAEMKLFAQSSGASLETLSGLSGFGDLVLTCTSEKSRNFTYGLALGRGTDINPETTVEGVVTAKAVSNAGISQGIEMPVTTIVTQLIEKKLTVKDGIEQLMSRPLKKE